MNRITHVCPPREYVTLDGFRWKHGRRCWSPAAPLAEEKYWRMRKHAFSSIHKQLRGELAVKAAVIVKERTTDRSLVKAFAAQADDIRKVGCLLVHARLPHPVRDTTGL